MSKILRSEIYETYIIDTAFFIKQDAPANRMTASLILTITSQQKGAMGAEASKTFDINGGTIGRSNNNDWILPDPDRFMSSQHALILYQKNEFLVTDLSTNGVYINNAEDALGKGNTTSLNRVRTLTVGKFTIKVDIKSEAMSSGLETMVAPPSPDTSSLLDDLIVSTDAQDPMDFLGKPQDLSPEPSNLLVSTPDTPISPFDSGLPEDLFSEEKEFSSTPLIEDAFEAPKAIPDPFLDSNSALPAKSSGIPENWDQTTFTSLDSLDLPEDPFASAIRPTPPRQTVIPTSPSTKTEPSITPTSPSTSPPPTNDNFQETLISQAPELDTPSLSSLINDTSSPATSNAAQTPPVQTTTKPLQGNDSQYNYPQAAASFRENGLDPQLLNDANFVDLSVSLLPFVINGLLSTLRSRAEIKNELRASKTILQQVENNPLKFSVNTQDAVQNLLTNQRPGFLSPQASVKQAFEDLTQHETALITGIQSGLNALLGKISPESIESRIENQENKKNLFGKISSSKKWDYYKETYQHIMEHSNDSFIDMFGDDFVKGYENYISKHKQNGKN